jgi:hypothetical protein
MQDVGSIHWKRGRGEEVTNTNSRRRVQLCAGHITSGHEKMMEKKGR